MALTSSTGGGVARRNNAPYVFSPYQPSLLLWQTGMEIAAGPRAPG